MKKFIITVITVILVGVALLFLAIALPKLMS